MFHAASVAGSPTKIRRKGVFAAADAVALTLDSWWDTALGNSDAALQDGGEWDRYGPCAGGQYDLLEVFDAEPLGLPSGYNALGVKSDGGNCGSVIRYNADTGAGNPVADRGQDVYGRMYLTCPDNPSVGHHHFIAHDYVGSEFGAICIVFSATPNGDGTWGFGLRGTGHETLTDPKIDDWDPSDDDGSSAAAFSSLSWMRFEYRINILDPDTGAFKLFVRLYDDQGVLQYDENDFWDTGWSQSHNIGALNSAGDWILAMDDSGTANHSDPGEGLREFGIGVPGNLGHPENLDVTYYVTGVAMSMEGWIGSQGGPF